MCSDQQPHIALITEELQFCQSGRKDAIPGTKITATNATNDDNHLVLLKIPSRLLQSQKSASIADGAGANNAKTKNVNNVEIAQHNKSLVLLTEIINRGYDMPRFKYKVVNNPRITTPETISEDFGFTEAEPGSFLYVFIDIKCIANSIPKIADNFTVVSESEVVVGAGTGDKHKVKVLEIDGLLAYSEELHQATIGTIAIKPYEYYTIENNNNNENNKTSEEDSSKHCSMEITSFTSFRKNTGTVLLNLLIKDINATVLSRSSIIVNKLIAIVIVEHELVGYYEKKLGFVETDRWEVSLSKTKNKKGIEALKDFHLAYMYREI